MMSSTRITRGDCKTIDYVEAEIDGSRSALRNTESLWKDRSYPEFMQETKAAWRRRHSTKIQRGLKILKLREEYLECARAVEKAEREVMSVVMDDWPDEWPFLRKLEEAKIVLVHNREQLADAVERLHMALESYRKGRGL